MDSTQVTQLHNSLNAANELTWFAKYFWNLFIAGGIITATLTGYFKFFKGYIKPWINSREIERMKRVEEMRKVIENQQHFFEQISLMKSNLDWIALEFKTNGGESMRDKIDGIVKGIRTISLERNASLQLSKDATFKCDESGYCIMVNHAMCDLFGGTTEQLIGQGWLTFIKESNRQRVETDWDTIMKSGTEMTGYYTIENGVTGEDTPIKCSVVLNRDKNQLISSIGVFEKMNKKNYKMITSP